MSILIKGMEMPKGCGRCPCSIYGDCDAVTPRKHLTAKYRWSGGERPDWCPLVPIPPHGRLIDADYADEYAYDELELANNYLTGWEAARAMQKIYQAAPTIIPADKDGET